MDDGLAPAPWRRLTIFGTRRRGRSASSRGCVRLILYNEVAREERVTPKRVRQIVAEVLRRREVDDGSAHARPQLARLEPLLKVAAEAVADGDVRAIPAALKVLDRIDRYQKAAKVDEKYGEEMRRKLLAKLNRMAEAPETQTESGAGTFRNPRRQSGGLDPRPCPLRAWELRSDTNGAATH